MFFDGERNTIPVGHYELPTLTLYHAKNQNPIMGSADPNNPTVAGARYLVVEEDEEGYGVALTKEEWESSEFQHALKNGAAILRKSVC